MYNRILLLIVMFCSLSFLSAQSQEDLKLRVENSFQKLYENPDIAIHAAKEIRNTNDSSAIRIILAKAYLLKGDYLESVRISFQKSRLQNSDQKLLNGLMVANEFYHLNLYEQTSKILQPLLSGKLNTSSIDHEEIYALLFQLEAKNLMAIKKLTEAEKSLLKSSGFIKKNKPSMLLIAKENQFLAASIALEKGNLAEAKSISNQLAKELHALPRAKYLTALSYQLRGKLFFEEQSYTQATDYLQNALTSVDNINYEPLKSSIYLDLAKSYGAVKNNDQYEIFKNKHRESLKALEENKKQARRELIQLNTELVTENNKRNLQSQKTILLYLGWFALLVLTVLVYFYVREIQKSKMLMRQIRFFRTVNIRQNQFHKEEELQTKEPSKKPLVIPKETEKEILLGLEQFEESKKYLDNNMSLATLAVALNTNTKYLSEIINKYKNKNFNTYINELRVKYLIHLLANDKSYLQYKISYIAEIGGFTSHSAFTNIFKSVTGMSPNEYMQTLRHQ